VLKKPSQNPNPDRQIEVDLIQADGDSQEEVAEIGPVVKHAVAEAATRTCTQLPAM
jgi:hypothetical protein